MTLPEGATVKIVDNTRTFADVPDSHWGAEAIGFAASRTLMEGTGPATFSPEKEMTRAMAVTVLARWDGVDSAAGEGWYVPGRDWAVAQGVSDGANIHDPITREQLAVMLYRYAGQPEASGSLAGFADGEEVSPWARDAMLWATGEGLIQGVGGNWLDPQGTATRGEAAVILARFAALTAQP